MVHQAAAGTGGATEVVQLMQSFAHPPLPGYRYISTKGGYSLRTDGVDTVAPALISVLIDEP